MNPSLDAPEFDLRGRLRGLWRHKSVVLLVLILSFASAGVALWRQDRVFQGEVKVLLRHRATEAIFASPTQGQPEQARLVRDEMEVIKSEPVAEKAARTLGRPEKVAVSQVGETDVVKIKGRSSDRARAAAIAQAYATAYIDLRRSQALADLDTARQSVQAKIADLQRQIESLDKQIGEVVDRQISAALAQARAVNPQAIDPSQYLRSEPVAGLSARREHVLAQQSELKQQLDVIDLDAALRSGGAQLVTTSTIPTFQVEPRPVRTLLVAAVLGLALGIGLALLLDYLDDSVRSKDDLDRLLPMVPVLGLLPHASRRRDDDEPTVACISEPSSPAAEAFRSLRAALQFVGVERPPKVFQITSARPGDGKTSVASNLGVVLARAGERVVVVDCDLRRACLHEFLDVPNHVGFTSALLHEVDLADAVQAVPNVEHLSVLPSGPLPPNPSELLSSRRSAEIFRTLQQAYDVVLVDCPPLLPVADAIAVSTWVDASLLVVSAGLTTRRDIRRAVELLRHADASLVGTVLNRVRLDDNYGYPYRYGDPRAKARYAEQVGASRHGKGAELTPEAGPPATPSANGHAQPAANGQAHSAEDAPDSETSHRP